MRHLVALLVGLAVCACAQSSRADFVPRAPATVAWAIGVGPGGSALSRSTRLRYAKALLKVAEDFNFDPFTGVSLIEHESRWRAAAVSASGEDFGLAQIRARYRKGCTDDADPVGAPDEGCRRAQAMLLDPLTNMRAMGGAIRAWRTRCKKETGRAALLHRWLAGYGGMHRPSKGLRCGQRKVKGRWRDQPLRKGIKWIVEHRKRLIRKLRRRRRR